jgi:hypothetical protein
MVFGLIWLVMFAVTLVTEARFMARGVMPLITAVCVLWFAYWTISTLRGTNGSADGGKEETNAKTDKASSE